MTSPRTMLAACAVAMTAACARPDPPTIVPISAQITSISIQGVDLVMQIEATNPNRIDLSAQSVTAKITVDPPHYDLGTFTQTTPITLPSNVKTTLSIPLSVKWRDAAALGKLAGSDRAVPYDVDGTIDVGGASLHVTLPFHMSGTIAHDDIVRAAVKTLPFKFPIDTLHP